MPDLADIATIVAAAIAAAASIFAAVRARAAAIAVEKTRNELSRAREFETFERDRVAESLRSIHTGYVAIAALGEAMGLRSYIKENSLAAASGRLAEQLAIIQTNVMMLASLNAISTETSERCDNCIIQTRWSWQGFVGQLSLEDPSFRHEDPQAPAFSSPKAHEKYQELLDNVVRLRDAVFEVHRNIRMPGGTTSA